MILRCWNTAVKLAWDVRRSTFSFLVDRVLTTDMPYVMDGMLTRYGMYQQSLYMNNSMEIRILASTSSSDGRCTTGYNTMKMERETGLDVKNSSKQMIRKALCQSTVPAEEELMVPLLARLLQERRECKEADEDSKHLDSMVDMVCSSTFD